MVLTLAEPVGPMVAEAAGAGLHEEPGFTPVPRLQIVTVERAMSRREDTFRRAAREEEAGRQGALGP